ncbi:MAG: UDP-2,3-diacylglucosamine diphosphatase [Deltaproteobacteria bacterium]|nr:UDP-2,3-diacylglucosamine diphosphatase [Deltaproteobacteria bacterium]
MRKRPSSRTCGKDARVADFFSFDYMQDCGAPRSGFGLTPALRRIAPDVQMRLRINTAIAAAPADSRKLYRSIWISDFHLGTDACQAEALLDFLRHHQAEKLYLVGDIVDGWNAGRSWCFDSAQKAVAGEIRAWLENGTHVEFLPGNHDQACLDLVESLLGLTPHCTELIHRTADGRRMLVTHGHQFDGSLTSGNWLKGRQAYTVALRIHQWYGRAWAQRSEWPHSLSAYLRHRVKQVVEYLTCFDDRAVFEAVRRYHADGLICGHVHRAEQRLIGPIWYINDGDWVQNCTALVEDYSGALRLLRWGAPSSSLIPDEIEATLNQETS